MLSYFFYKYYNNDETEEIQNIDESKYYYTFPRIIELHKNDKPIFDFSKINFGLEKGWYDWRAKNKLYELLNMPFPPVEKPKRFAVDQVDKGKYIQKKLRIQTGPNSLSYAYLLVPKNASFPIPGIIAMHQHGGFYDYGKDEPAGNIGNADLFYGKELAERGYVVFILDVPFLVRTKT